MRTGSTLMPYRSGKLGVRYFEAFNLQKNVLAPVIDEDDLINRIHDKPLTKIEKAALLEISFTRGDLSLEDYEQQLTTLNSMSS